MTSWMVRSRAPTASSSTWMDRALTCPSWWVWIAPRSSSSTTTTSPTRRSVLTTPHSPWPSNTSARSRTRSRARSCGVRRGIRRATPKPHRATTCASCSATSRARPSRPRCERRSCSCSPLRASMSTPRLGRASSPRLATRCGRSLGRPKRAATASSSSSSSLRMSRALPHTLRRCAGCATARSRSRAWRLTPTSSGSCSKGWRSMAQHPVPTSTRRWHATTPRTASRRRRARRQRYRVPTTSARPSTRSSRATTCPT